MKARLPQGMGGGPQNMQSMLRQAQKMQENIEAKKAELEEKEYVVSSGGGMVEVTANGKHEIKAIGINPDVVDRRGLGKRAVCRYRRAEHSRSLIGKRYAI